jgi:hypothetical protein
MARYDRVPTGQWTLGSNESTIYEAELKPQSSSTESQTLTSNSNGVKSGPVQEGSRPLGSPFRSALTKFRARLSGTQLQEFQSSSYEQLCQDIVRLQYQQENEKKMRNMSRLQSFLEAMHQFSKVIEIFLNVSDAVAFVWGPIKFLLLVLSRTHLYITREAANVLTSRRLLALI